MSFISESIIPDCRIKPARKRIIICCDGTWQSAVSGKENCPSNVTRLCRAINSVAQDPNDGENWQQVVWYDSGVGTTSTGLGPGLEGAIGQGLEGNVIEAYNFCVLNWNPGDKIMCFGFSRGAYTARTIAGLISDIGICSKKQLQQFPDLWKLYKQKKSGDDECRKRFYGSALYYSWREGRVADPQPDPEDRPDGGLVWDIKAHGEWAPEESMEVEVVGVFDTVGALGLPEVFGMELPKWTTIGDKPEWHNVELSANIKHAFQALALDEHREAFTPTLYYIKKPEDFTDSEIEAQRTISDNANTEWYDMVSSHEPNLEKLRDLAQTRDEATEKVVRMEENNKMKKALVDSEKVLEQVWFPGYHIHIGGGSSDTLLNKDNMEEMSNITLAWMLDQIEKYVSIDRETIKEDGYDRQGKFARLNNERQVHLDREKEREKEGWGQWIWRNGKWAASKVAHPLTEEKNIHYEERRHAWGVGDLNDSFTTMYKANGSKSRTPGRYALDKKGNKLGETHEYIHPTTGFRVQQQDKKAEEARKQKDHRDHKNWEKLRYSPIDLEGDKYKRQKKVDKQGKVTAYEYVFKYKDCSETLPEWRLGDADCYERLAIEGSAAYDYVDELDRTLETGIKTVRLDFWGDKASSFQVPSN
ncbi:hypothetical protein BPAE_0327g00080 [Botrytis paeoniae]|uniref:T6SS Phospholipase effector Tle1-like catalytic domain-containing protein n=1 Tax=Botrytis paeoniae TaxID=278948 RepID=A0A4Z1F656_9HELO|nr:hypothetical protein BPAE_0327g00080 [Botrytis paeoniae]